MLLPHFDRHNQQPQLLLLSLIFSFKYFFLAKKLILVKLLSIFVILFISYLFTLSIPGIIFTFFSLWTRTAMTLCSASFEFQTLGSLSAVISLLVFLVFS